MSLQFTVVEYLTEDGKSPFGNWLSSIKDQQAKRAVILRIARIQIGNLGDYKSLGEGVYEFRIHQGAGHRIYFAKDGETIILLLCAGDKRTQDDDIIKARKYLQEYERSKQ